MVSMVSSMTYPPRRFPAIPLLTVDSDLPDIIYWMCFSTFLTHWFPIPAARQVHDFGGPDPGLAG